MEVCCGESGEARFNPATGAFSPGDGPTPEAAADIWVGSVVNVF